MRLFLTRLRAQFLQLLHPPSENLRILSSVKRIELVKALFEQNCYRPQMEMILVDPPLELRGYITSLWSLRGNPVGRYSGLPKPYVELIISMSGEHHWQRSVGSASHRYTEGWITPIQSGPRYARTVSNLHLVGVRLPIHTAASLFGPHINRDPATPIPIGDVFGTEAVYLREQLLECDSEHAKLHRLAKWIHLKLNQPPAFNLPSVSELRILGWKTDALADYYGLTPRGLRKRFNTEIGLGPKFWLQLNRFDSVIRDELNTIGLAAAAAAHGYADQAHMSSDFRRFAGRPPRNYLVNRRDQDAPDEAPHFIPAAP